MPASEVASPVVLNTFLPTGYAFKIGTQNKVGRQESHRDFNTEDTKQKKRKI